MNRAHISKYINSLLADISKLSNTLCAMNNTDIERYPDNYGMLGMVENNFIAFVKMLRRRQRKMWSRGAELNSM